MSSYIQFLTLAALFALLVVPQAAFAHEHRDVGKYEFVVGFVHEPAFEGEQNGVSVAITNKETGQPVENLADMLKAQVIFGDQQRDLALQPAWGEKGVYTSNFYPTVAGDYTFRFYGEIEGTSIDEKFTSKPGGFNAVQAPAPLQFPAQVKSNSQLSAELAAAQNTARTAMILGGTGLALGLAGLISALVALRGRRASTPAPTSTVART